MTATRKLVPVGDIINQWIAEQAKAGRVGLAMMMSPEATRPLIAAIESAFVNSPAPPADLDPTERERVITVLAEVAVTLRPFSSKLIGGEGSPARLQQQDQIAAHGRLVALLDELRGRK